MVFCIFTQYLSYVIDTVKNKVHDIRDACKKHHVKTLYLIGSATNPEYFSTNSDIDLLYTFNKSEIPESEYADNFFDLLFFLEDIFKRKVDLVPEEKLTNPYFIDSINHQKEAIYES